MSLAGRRVLYISYNGMLDPLGQSQVIPYLKELSKLGVRFTLLSFERDQAYGADGASRVKALNEELSQFGIKWHYLRYHQRPSIPATAFDVNAGIRFARRLVRRDAIELVHARGYIPAVIALSLKRRCGIRMIFDVRGLMADEYVDAGHWRKGSLAYRLTKSRERRLFESTDAVVTLTERIWPIITQWEGLRGREVLHEVVACCVDLGRFRFSAAERLLRRRELRIDDRFVVVYSGSIDGWYLTEAMVDFFSALRRQRNDALLLWLTPSRHQRIRIVMQERGFGEGDYRVVAAAPGDVSSYLSASDVGLAFIKPCLSKVASSPTKYAEYLACGLPLIINNGIGDCDALISEEKTGALVYDFNEEEYSRAATNIENFANAKEQTRQHNRQVAERLFDVSRVGAEKYARLYSSLLLTGTETRAGK